MRGALRVVTGAAYQTTLLLDEGLTKKVNPED
jgi:hypothetical protein